MTTQAGGGSKQEKVLNDLASFYMSKVDFDFTPPASPANVSDNEEEEEAEDQRAAAPVVIQRNVFISSQDVASRRRRKPGSKPSTTTTGSSTATSAVEENRRRPGVTRRSSSGMTGQNHHRGEGRGSSGATATGEDKSQRRSAPGRSKSDSMEASSHSRHGNRTSTGRSADGLGVSGHSISHSSHRRSSTSTSQSNNNHNNNKEGGGSGSSSGGGGGSALERLKQRAASNERFPSGRDSRKVADEGTELNKSQQGASHDPRRRNRREQDSNKNKQDSLDKEKPSSNSKSAENEINEMDTSRQSNNSADSQRDRRRPLSGRSRSSEGLSEMDQSRSSGRNRKSREPIVIEDDTADTAPSTSTHSDGSSGVVLEPKVTSALDKLKRAAGSSDGGTKTGSLLDKLKNATNDAMKQEEEQEGGDIPRATSSRNRSKWAGMKHGMEFINKAKAVAEQQRHGGSGSGSGSHSHRRRRDRHRPREVSKSRSRSPKAAAVPLNENVDEMDKANDTPQSPIHGQKQQTESRPISRSPKKRSENASNRSPKNDSRRSESSRTTTTTTTTASRSSRGRGSSSSKWSAIKARSLSRGHSLDRGILEEEGEGPKSPDKEKSSEPGGGALALQLAQMAKKASEHTPALSPIKSPRPGLVRSNSDTSVSVLKAALDNDLVTNEISSPKPENSPSIGTASKKPGSNYFKSLLMGKNKKKENVEPSPALDDTTRTAGSEDTGGGSGAAAVTATATGEQLNPIISPRDLNKKKSMLKKLLSKKSSGSSGGKHADGAEEGEGVEVSASLEVSSEPELAADEDGEMVSPRDMNKKKSMLKKLLLKPGGGGHKKEASENSALDDTNKTLDSHKTDSTTEEDNDDTTPAGTSPKDANKKKSMLKKLLNAKHSGGGGKKGDGEDIEGKKGRSKWGGLKNGMDFTSKLMKVAGDKKKKEKGKGKSPDNADDEGKEFSIDDMLEVGGGDDDEDKDDGGNKGKKKSSGGLWNIARSGAGGSKEESGGGGESPATMDYGLMMSVASFSPDALDGLGEVNTPDVIQEGDEDEDSEFDDDDDGEGDAQPSFRSTKSGSKSIATEDSRSNRQSGEPDAFDLFSKATPAPASGDRRGLMASLAAPSIRFDFDFTTEKVVSRGGNLDNGGIEEGNEDEEEEEEVAHETKPAKSSKATEVVEEGDEEEEDEEEEEDDEESKDSIEDLGVEQIKRANDDYDDDAGQVDDESESENEAETFLSPMKFMQLKIGPRSTVSGGDLSIAIHALSKEGGREKDKSDTMVIHGMDEKGVDFNSTYESKHRQRHRQNKRSEHAEPKSGRHFKDSTATANPTAKEEEDSNDEDNENLASSPSPILPGNTSESSTGIRSEYDRLQKELEDSIARAKAAREEVRYLQQEIQKKRNHYGEVEKRRQLSLKALTRQKVVVKR